MSKNTDLRDQMSEKRRKMSTEENVEWTVRHLTAGDAALRKIVLGGRWVFVAEVPAGSKFHRETLEGTPIWDWWPELAEAAAALGIK